MTIEEISSWIQSRQSLYPAQMQAGIKIEDEKIWQLLRNANYAPSHKRTEPWRYIVFNEDSLKKFYMALGDIYKQITPQAEFKAEKLKKYEHRSTVVSHVIAICMKRDEAKRVPVQEEEYAVACSVQNILLSMKALGIIGYWSTGKIAFSEEIKDFLQLGKEDKCMGFLQLGVPKNDLPEIPKNQMSDIESKVKWI